MKKPSFWKEKPLEELSPDEWESLCDGCARCCLYKLQDEEGTIYYTRVACRYLDLDECRCTAYENRSVVMPTCVVLDVEKAHELGWMPPTCAYRLLALGRSLPDWHHLVCGSHQVVHENGVSIRDFAISEDEINMEELEEYIFDSLEDDSLD